MDVDVLEVARRRTDHYLVAVDAGDDARGDRVHAVAGPAGDVDAVVEREEPVPRPEEDGAGITEVAADGVLAIERLQWPRVRSRPGVEPRAAPIETRPERHGAPDRARAARRAHLQGGRACSDQYQCQPETE